MSSRHYCPLPWIVKEMNPKLPSTLWPGWYWSWFQTGVDRWGVLSCDLSPWRVSGCWDSGDLVAV